MPDLINTHQSPGRTPDTPHKWQDFAACLTVDPELFFPEPGDWQTARQAKEICATCPVINKCAQLGKNYPHGIWAGKSPNERGTRPTGRNNQKED